MKKYLLLTTLHLSLFAQDLDLNETGLQSPNKNDRNLQMLTQLEKSSHQLLYPLPPSERRGYYPFAEILVWRADVNGSELVNHEVITANVIENQSEKLSGTWRPGTRVGIGYQLDRFDDWRFYLTYTFYHAQSVDKKIATGDINSDFLRQSWIPFLGPQVTKANGHWTINFNWIDFELSRTIEFSNKILARPHMGVRGAFIDFDYLASYLGSWTAIKGNSIIHLDQKTYFKGENDFYAGGLRFGSEFQWNFANDWSLLFDCAGSILSGSFDIHQKFEGFDAVGKTTLVPVIENFKETMLQLRTNLDASLGFKWEKAIGKPRLRKVSVLIGYELSEWFRLNELIRVFRSTDIIASTSTVSTDNSNFVYHHISDDVVLQGLRAAVAFKF